VRWLQSQRDEDETAARDPAARVVALARKSETARSFEVALQAEGIDASWGNDVELWDFLRAETAPNLKLDLAGARGLW
jgi:hypothetical protein